MTIELAAIRAIAKPWGSANRAPWSNEKPGSVIGEIWFGRPGQPDADTELLLKLLFTREPLSIQVHPDDRRAHALGMPRGKSEVWYVLSADAGAEVARGLRQAMTEDALRAAIADGSIVDLVMWQPVKAGDVIAIPAGTIHALGAGVVIAELQQRSDTTYRLFDFGRGRELHGEIAISASDHGVSAASPAPVQLSAARTLLIAYPQFVFERLTLRPASQWAIVAASETWLLVIEGSVSIGPVHAGVGEATFMDGDRAVIRPGPGGVVMLVGIVASHPADDFLTDVTPSPSIKADA